MTAGTKLSFTIQLASAGNKRHCMALVNDVAKRIVVQGKAEQEAAWHSDGRTALQKKMFDKGQCN